MKNKKIVLAYSGGLDTSVMIRWLKDKYRCDIIACVVDVGQMEDFNLIKKRALKSGAKKVYIIDAKEEFVKEYLYSAIKSNAIYENKYLLGTALARPLIAKKVAEIGIKEKAYALSHGATGKGNDQVRFELGFKYFAPEIKIIAPWRQWNIRSRSEEIEYAKKHNIEISVTKEKPYSSDANLWHISYEGGILEDQNNPPKEDMFQLTVSPQEAPSEPVFIEIEFKKGIPVRLNNKKYNPVELIHRLNEIAGKNGIGRVDIVENRLIGIKSRGVYETPAGTLLIASHRELESLVLDTETLHYKQILELKYAELIYYGLWYTNLRECIDAFINKTQEYVCGKIKLKLYKGNIIIVGRESKYSLYSKKLATFEKDELFNQKDAEGFINLFGLQTRFESLLRKRKINK